MTHVMPRSNYPVAEVPFPKEFVNAVQGHAKVSRPRRDFNEALMIA
jgi:hypothetical protein